jgi:hypothetical protein
MGDEISLVTEGFMDGLHLAASSWERSAAEWPEWSRDELREFGESMASIADSFLRARADKNVDAAVDFLAGQFAIHLKTRLTEHPDIVREFLRIGPLDLAAYAGDAVSELLAPLIWRHRVGEVFETGDVVRLLGISRQAVHKRVRTGSLIGLPGTQTTLFPRWQFNLERGCVRDGIADVVEQFRVRLGEDVDPLLMATWATTAQEEDLEGAAPARVIDAADRVPDEVVASAARTAARLAQ